MSKRKATTQPSPLPHIHCGISGAYPGDLLRGSLDASDVTLRVHSGTVHAPRIFAQEAIQEHGRDRVVESIAKHFGWSAALSAAQAVAQFADFPVIDAPNHLPVGAGCGHKITEGCACESTASFVVVSQGRWHQWAAEHGCADELEDMVAEQRVVTWREVGRLFYTPGKVGGKLLASRTSLFHVVAGPQMISADDPRVVSAIDARLTYALTDAPTDDGSVVYELDGHLIRIPPSAPAFTEHQIVDLAAATSGCAVLSVERVVGRLKPLTGGALKSLMQKAVRFHAHWVNLHDGGVLVPTQLVSIVAILLLFSTKGSFSPELQLFTRGCSAAFKRLAVILLEDSFVVQQPAVVLPLVSLALVCQRIPEFNPSVEMVRFAACLIRSATESSLLVSWRPDDRATETCHCTAAEANELLTAASVMRIVRSFPGDMDMFDTVAKMAPRLGMCRALVRADIMPIWHLVDQHAFPGVAHALMQGTTFAGRYGRIFKGCTGVNPRSMATDMRGFEQRNADVRFAQQCCGEFALANSQALLPTTDDQVELTVRLNPGVLAAGVGPVTVRVDGRDLLVLLGTDAPEEEMVMLRPTRATRDLFGAIDTKQREAAIALARKGRHSVRSPMLPSGQHIATFHECWRLDGEPWHEIVAGGIALSVPLLSAIPMPVLSDNAVIHEALRSCGVGMVPDADEMVIGLVRSVAPSVGLRCASLLRQQYTSIKLPTPGLDGKLASDQLAAYPGDWNVWRLLVLVSRMVPGALRPLAPPNFTIPDARLLRVVEEWVLAGCRADSSIDNRWPSHAGWQAFGTGPNLMEHQKAAVQRMHERDASSDTGHFLVMDTGLGKTVTALVYAYRWLCQYGGSVMYIVWITPHGTTDNLCQQLRGTWEVPVHLVPRVSAAKTSIKHIQLKPFHINVIHADHLRTAIDRGLADAATKSFVIVDEVDEMYAPTLRTSAARRVTQLSPKFVAQTATPVRKTEAELEMWLRDTCAFPVTPQNMLVAASGMVSMQMELGIAGVEQLIRVPMDPVVRQGCRSLVDARAWARMARLVQDHTDEALVAQAILHAGEDRASYPAGGVLLVADSAEHQARLVEMCNVGDVRVGTFDALEASDAASYGIVVVTKKMVRGYNSAVRLGRLVTGVFAGNGAARHQMRGRLRRIGQLRPQVLFVTVVMEHSILELLHDRQGRVDSMNISLEQLGQTFSADEMATILA